MFAQGGIYVPRGIRSISFSGSPARLCNFYFYNGIKVVKCCLSVSHEIAIINLVGLENSAFLIYNKHII